MLPSELISKGVADAIDNDEGKFSPVSPRIAKVICMSCLRCHPSLDGVWVFKACCVFCQDRRTQRPKPMPLLGTHPDPALSDNLYYLYGFLAGKAARLGIELGDCCE